MGASAVLKLQKVGFTVDQVEALSDFMDTQAASKTDLEAARHGLETKITDTKAELKSDIQHLEAKIEAARTESRADNLRLETKIAEAKADTLKTMAALVFSAVVVNALVVVGAVFGLAKMLVHG